MALESQTPAQTAGIGVTEKKVVKTTPEYKREELSWY